MAIAHIREKDKKIQTVEEHLLGVRELAELYGAKIGVKHITGLAGMLHDIGKYSNDFTEYITNAAYQPDAPSKRGSVDHSTAGGKLLFEYFHSGKKVDLYKGLLTEIVGNAILSHHSYLVDFLSSDLNSPYLTRVQDKKLPGYESVKEQFYEQIISEEELIDYVNKAAFELETFLKKGEPYNYESKLMFLTKYVYSALIDADRTDTRLFEEELSERETSNQEDLLELYYQRLIEKLNGLKDQINSKNPINILRQEMSEQCDRFAEKPSGIYTLSIPTGGGKTMASLRYALKHSLKYHKKRIIYVVPYTTIIEQNAEEIRMILRDRENILEHHSNVIEDSNDNDENQDGIVNVQQKLKLAKDNWDSPIIFTTMVQFLNVFFAKGSRYIRRLHNLSDSVIIFDEVQKVPINSVSLFNLSLNFLKNFTQSSIVLCTATQPALDFVENKLDINTDAEIIDNLGQVIDAFKRVEIIDKATGQTFNNEKLAYFIKEKIGELQSILVILNTKSVVRDLYNQLRMKNLSIPIYHLSTGMCAAHRYKILERVKDHLKKNEKVICISTQLIEAGVDISFDSVIRSLAGLDSIAQAAGRCNRHGEKEIQYVYVIDHEDEYLNHLKEINVGKKVSARFFVDLKRNKTSHGGHILSSQAIKRYFQEYYSELDADLNYFVPELKKTMIELLTETKDQNSLHNAYLAKEGKNLPLFLVNSYRTAAENFYAIDDNTTSVIVPFEVGKEIIAELNSNQSIQGLSQLLRKAQQYTINLYSYELDRLAKSNGLITLLDGKIFALKDGAYHLDFGFNLENDSEQDLLYF